MLEKVEKKGKKAKIKKIALVMLVGILTLGTITEICDNNFDHENKLCPLCYVFGMEHQAKEINKNSSKNRVYAYYDEDDEIVEIYDRYTKEKTKEFRLEK